MVFPAPCNKSQDHRFTPYKKSNSHRRSVRPVIDKQLVHAPGRQQEREVVRSVRAVESGQRLGRKDVAVVIEGRNPQYGGVLVQNRGKAVQKPGEKCPFEKYFL